ncbi:glycosyl hydrolase-like protein family 88 [Polyplosphaeria fusca]|uniref:Glycosyl hydrolase-like protein family 88 n=1 Tax=Polyplosphaeria fusca TaxID=682080 RepID=A0A9P4R661_9PLEO|nr:glycosyl hydrolase-like protein family 88 [Polyplosphaeria fusca]
MHLSVLTIAILTHIPPLIATPTPLPYSEWMATSFLSKPQIKVDRHYVSAVLYEGLEKAASLHSNPSLLNHTSTHLTSLLSSNGTLKGWSPTSYSLDDLRIGNNLLHHYLTTNSTLQKTNFKRAATSLRHQLNSYPRTPSGGFWHRAPKYPNQMWLDGIYMADVFYATYTHLFDRANGSAWEDIALQFDLVETHCRNATSGLLVHGYDESKSAPWADGVSGASPHVWDRAVGWYFMALVEVLQVYPQELSGYARLRGYFGRLAEALRRVQDGGGGWWLVMDEGDEGREGNYIESSATAMFAYGYLKGARTGLLESGYRETAKKAYGLLVDRFVKREENGTLSWEGTVLVGSLDKNASYEYYISVPLSENDGKGAGPFMFASVEMEMWQGS